MKSGTTPNYRFYPEFQYLEKDLLAYIPGGGWDGVPWQTGRGIVRYGYPNLAVPTTYSNVISCFSQFPYRKSILSAIAMTNLVPNPSAELAIAGFLAIGGGVVTVTRSYENSVAGNYCAKFVCDGAAVGQGININHLGAEIGRAHV